MPARIPLPADLIAAPFTVGDARDLAIPVDRLRSVGLQRSYRGVRSVGLDLETLIDRCLAYSARMPDDHVFSHETAARLWGLPIPLYADQRLHVSAPRGRRAPQVHGVAGHQVELHPHEVKCIRGVRIVSPELAWSQLAGRIALDDLVACGDHLVSERPRRREQALSTVLELQAVTASRRRMPGHLDRVLALPLVRAGSWSRTESLARLLLVRCGLPEPRLNEQLAGFDVDLSWPELQVGFEYLGDHHRETEQFRWDVERLERMRDRDVLVSQATADDLFDRAPVIVRRVERDLRARGWSGVADLRLSGHFRR